MLARAPWPLFIQRPTHFLSTLRIKKAWWDQIPTPACSPLVAIIIQDSQVGGCECSVVGLPATGRVGARSKPWALQSQGG